MPAEIEQAYESLGQRSSLFPLDAAVEYLRQQIGRVLPAYVLAMLPMTLVMLYLIDALSSQHRSALPLGCLTLLGALAWRWLGVAAVQRRIQQDLRGEPPLALRRRWLSILLTRLGAHVMLTWGVFLLFPFFYGLLLSSFAAPALLERPEPVAPRLKHALSLVHKNEWRLLQGLLTLAALAALAALAVVVVQYMLLYTVLGSLLGLEPNDLRLTLTSGTWWLCLIYLLWLLLDLYWTVASVMLFYDLQSRRLGSDLRLRLRLLQGPVAGTRDQTAALPASAGPRADNNPGGA